MPEIAEVESIARFLNEKYQSKKLLDIKTYPFAHQKGLPRLINTTLFDKIVGKKIICVGRMGKYIFIKLDGGLSLVFHLMMSGVLAMEGFVDKTKHLYAKMVFDNGPPLLFFDARRFGQMFVWKSDDLCQLAAGIDVLRDSLNGNLLLDMLKTDDREIKVFLLESQKKIVGLGNIYTCEVLWHAKINPFIRCAEFSLPCAKKLALAITSVVNRAVQNRGSTLLDSGYLLPDGSFGSDQNFHVVYGKKICICGSEIVRVVQKKRSTFYCVSCQAGGIGV